MVHSDSQPNGQGHDPVFWGYQGLVVSEVAKFVDGRGIGNDCANELFAIGKAELDKYIEHVEVVEPDGRTQLWPCPGYDRRTKPVEYIRTCIKHAIQDYWKTDRQLAIPPSTRRDMVKRGETPPDHKRKSLQGVFYRNGDGGGLINRKNLARDKWEALNTPSCFDDLETLEVVYSLCRDDLDRAIVDARLVGFPDVAEVAEQLGLSVSEVTERLKQLERRYYKLYGKRPPTNTTARPDLPRNGAADVSPRRPVVFPQQRITLQQYEQQVREKIREAKPNPKPSEDSYGQPNILELEASRLYKDEDGQWCYRGDCCPTPR